MGSAAEHFSHIGRIAVSMDLQEPLGAVASAHDPLEEIRSTQDEFTDFFGDVFDELQAFSLELFARHKCLESDARQKVEIDANLDGYREEFQRCIEGLQQVHEQLRSDREETQQSLSEIRDGCQRFVDGHAELQETRDEFRGIVAEFASLKNDVQHERGDLRELYRGLENQLTQLAALAAEFNAVHELAPRESHDPSNDARIATILETTQQQQADWQQQRAALEADLEAMRRRAAEQAELIGEQKRLAAVQQSELAGEMKRMRSLLETLSGQVRGDTALQATGRPSQPVDSSVLGSVLAQFEILQRDVAHRRAKRSGDSHTQPLSPLPRS